MKTKKTFKKNAILFFTVMLTLFAGAAVSFACSCASSDSVEEEYKNVDIVFTGKAVSVRDVMKYQKSTTFELLQSYKGDLPEHVRVLTATPGPSCGMTFELGEEYLVYAYWQNDLFQTNQCSRTRKLSEAHDDVNRLEVLRFFPETEESRKSRSLQKTQNFSALSACVQAGGKFKQAEECDGSLSDWCEISAREQCYADQVQNGHCTAGEFSEELNGIVGITPRVLCNEVKGGFVNDE